MSKFRSLIANGSAAMALAFLGHVAGAASIYELSSLLFKDISGVRALLWTGASTPPRIATLIHENSGETPIVLEARNEVPLRETPPRPDGFVPLRKGPEVTQIRPKTEWIVIDSVKTKKLTGDDTWVRVANKDEAAQALGPHGLKNLSALRAAVDNSSSKEGFGKVPIERPRDPEQ